MFCPFELSNGVGMNGLKSIFEHVEAEEQN